MYACIYRYVYVNIHKQIDALYIRNKFLLILSSALHVQSKKIIILGVVQTGITNETNCWLIIVKV